MDGQTTIAINGKAVGLRFNYQSVMEMAGVKGGNNPVKNLISIVWGGIAGYAFMKQTDPPVSFEEVCEWYEEISLSEESNEDVDKIMAAFNSSTILQKIEKKLADEEAKKNMSQTTEIPQTEIALVP